MTNAIPFPSARDRRRAYLEAAGRSYQLFVEGFLTFTIHQGGRSKHTPMDELSRLCMENPDPDDLPAITTIREPSDVVNPNAPVGPKDRAIASMRNDGYKLREIAAELGMPINTVKKRMRVVGLSKPRGK